MNLNPKIDGRIIIAVLAMGCLAVAGVAFANHQKIVNGAAEEAKLQETEIPECKRRLALFYDAWKQYRADHKGAEPPNVECLVPKYIKDPSLLICPTAARWQAKHHPLDQGRVTINNEPFVETYGFRWTGAGYTTFVKKQGDKLPLIVCPSHIQAIYIAAYKGMPKSNSIDPADRPGLTPLVRDMPVFAARRNGKVEALDSNEIP